MLKEIIAGLFEGLLEGLRNLWRDWQLKKQGALEESQRRNEAANEAESSINTVDDATAAALERVRKH